MSGRLVPVEGALVVALIIAACVSRLLPHPPNFTALGAVALFAGACLRPLPAVLCCLGALLLSDLLLGLYAPLGMLAVYAGSLLGVPMGRCLLAGAVRPVRLVLAAGAGATVFFVVSNLGVWWEAYPHDAVGLLACYIAALPFFGPTLLGNLCWVPALFGLRALLLRGCRYLARGQAYFSISSR